MSKIYLELDEREGRLFEFSKDEKPGFKKHVSSTGKESYRKIYDKGLVGKLKFISEFENDFGKGKFKVCVITIEDKDKNQVSMKLPILTAKGSLNEYFEQLVTFLPNLKVGEDYRIFPYSMDTTYKNAAGEEKPTTNRGFSIHLYDMENDEKGLKIERAHKFGKDGDIPAVVWTPEEDMGVTKNVKNDKERRNYLYKIFTASLTSSGETSSEQNKAPEKKEESKSTPEPSASANIDDEEDNDDLPF